MLADRPRDFAALAHPHVRMQLDRLEDLLPEGGDVAVYDRCRYELGVDHLEDILVLKVLVGQYDFHRRLALCLETRVDPDEARVVAARTSVVHLGRREAFGGRRRGRPCGGYKDLADVTGDRRTEVDELEPLGGDREIGRRNIAASRSQRGQQLIAAGGDERDADRPRAVL